MTEGATATWAERLNSACHLRVVEAQQNVPFSAHRAYIAPIGCHMRIRGSAEAAHISLEPDLANSTYVPSIDELMRSVATVFGARSLGVVLTGMGSDGAQGLLAIREIGGVTLAQPAESAFVGSMPVAAAEIGAVEEVVPLVRMAETIAERVAGRM
jgi:two-component system chemotaxis response regulator CheB